MTERVALARSPSRPALARVAPAATNGPVTLEVIEELSTALRALQVSTAELREQNDALISADRGKHRERERYRRLFDSSPDGYVVTDFQAVIRQANRAAGAMLGCDEAWLVGRPLAVFMPLGHRRRFRALLQRFRDGTEVTFDATIRTADADAVVAMRVLAVRGSPGAEGDELWWTMRDVSAQRAAARRLREEMEERRSVETALARSERRYRHLVENAQEFVYEADADGRFRFCNDRAARQLLGRDACDLVGRTLFEFVPRSHRKAVREAHRQRIARPGVGDYREFPLLHANGAQVWVGQRTMTVEDGDGGSFVQAVCRDLTDARHKLAALEQSGAQFRELSAYLQQQLETERVRIAHDVHDEIGAALTRIRMDLALRNGDDHPVDARDAALIERVDRAIALVRRVCDHLRPSLLDNMGLCAAIEWLADEARAAGKLEVEVALQGLSEELPPSRATALFRIVQEAVTNTMRHANATTLSISQRTMGGHIIIDVVDDGRGMPAVAAATSMGILGMRERAGALGGSVRIVGGKQGTHVTVTVPLKPGDANARAVGR